MKLAFDESMRTYSVDGHLHIAKSHISKATVNPYYGREIPNSEELGLIPDKIYLLLRDPDELRIGAGSFAGKPILIVHKPISANDHPKELVVGAIGSSLEFNDPYLDADLTFWENEGIAGIETDTQRELSASYHFVALMVPGNYQGQRYDGKMTQIIGNHLALVEDGRAGSDVLAADSKLELTPMKQTKLGKALIVALSAASPKLAQDSALPTLVGSATKKTFKKAEVRGKIVAIDSELNPDAIFDSLLALDAEPKEKPAEDMDPDDMDPAQDADPDDDEEEAKKKKAAMDAETDAKVKVATDSLRRDLRESDEARRAVRDVVGEVIAQDSASDIYILALDEMGVDHKGVEGVPALRALFNVAKTHTAPASAKPVAMDSASVVTQFPDVARFRQA